MYKKIVQYIQETFNTDEYIRLHEPRFIGNEKHYLNECIDSTFVSSVGKFVDRFEEITAEYTGAKYAIVTVNGTAALHIALLLSGVESDCEVITQPLSFISTTNAISYTGANPVFIDVDKDTMSLSPTKLDEFLSSKTFLDKNGSCYNKETKRKIVACIPMHTFGHPAKIELIAEICNKYNITLIEDAAESLGSKYKGKHTGVFGKFGILSYNGNKTITTGGGGMLITNDEQLAKKAKYITTQAKVPHEWEYIHNFVGYNYRMPNVNAAIGVAQMEKIDFFIENKRNLASLYRDFFMDMEIQFFTEPENCYSNYWLNAIILKNREQRNEFLKYTNANKVKTRPIWRLMNKLEMFKNCQTENLDNAEWLEDRVVNIPSSVRI
jgi:aminotransferase in exopolysaccharide biosynthesis